MTKILFYTAFLVGQIYASVTSQEIDYKGDTISVAVSFEQTNRIVLPSNITSKIYSKEKGIVVTPDGNQAFVKFAPTVTTTKYPSDEKGQDRPQKQEVKYIQGSPVELYLSTEDGITYPFILVPSKLDAQTINVTNKKQKKKELEFKEEQTPLRNTLDEITKKIFLLEEDEVLLGYESIKKFDEIASSDSIDIRLTEILTGNKLKIYKLEIKNKENKGLEMQERDLIPLVKKSIYRIAIFYDNEVFEIPPHGKAQAIIIVANEEQQ